MLDGELLVESEIRNGVVSGGLFTHVFTKCMSVIWADVNSTTP